MNTNNFFHCDVKPENICVIQNGDKYLIIIIDFGFTQEVPAEEAKSRVLNAGTPYYKYIGEKRLDLYDIWAYIMVTIDLFVENESENLVAKNNADLINNLFVYIGNQLNIKRQEICTEIRDFFIDKSSTNPILRKLFNAFTGGGESAPFKYGDSILFKHTTQSPDGCVCEKMWDQILNCFTFEDT
jgi:serine/threonine protein kinase